MPGSEYYDEEKRNMTRPQDDRPRCPRCHTPTRSDLKNVHGLCRRCQDDLGEGAKLTAWVAGGKKQELKYRKGTRFNSRTRPRPRPAVVREAPAPTARLALMCPPLETMHLEDLLKHMGQVKNRLHAVNLELIKRRRDLQSLIHSLDDEITPGGADAEQT